MSRTSDKTTRVPIRYGGDAFDVTVTRVPGDRLAIDVHPDGSVTARAPASQTAEAIRDRLIKRAGWIARQRSAFAKHRPLPTPRRYVSGETHLYLGRQYRLKVLAGPMRSVKLAGGYIRVTCKSRDAGEVRELLENWFRLRAAEAFDERLRRCRQRAVGLQIPEPKVVLRRMKTRWGSCTRGGRILLNPDLVKVPGPCVEYVVMHELCHLKVLRHDRYFYRLLDRYMPDWKERKRRLDGCVLPTPF